MMDKRFYSFYLEGEQPQNKFQIEILKSENTSEAKDTDRLIKLREISLLHLKPMTCRAYLL